MDAFHVLFNYTGNVVFKVVKNSIIHEWETFIKDIFKGKMWGEGFLDAQMSLFWVMFCII